MRASSHWFAAGSLLRRIGPIILLCACPAGLRGEEVMHTSDDVATIKENIAKGQAVLLDVREMDEWLAGHLAAARLVPRSQLKDATASRAAISRLDKTKIIYTHCRAGRRALECGELLRQHGFDVRPIKLGYDELLKAGFEMGR